MSPDFRSNGTSDPNDAAYQSFAKNQFRDWMLTIDGLVQTPRQVSLAQLRMMKARTQITRHDCVEGWSAIGKWTGVPLSEVLALAQPQPAARYVVFHCADPMDADGTRYYESIGLEDAHHPQTILAYGLNDEALPVKNGAPIRLVTPWKYGFKSIKSIVRFSFTDKRPQSYWEQLAANEYGFWANINPAVPHPRWSQATEEVLGTGERVPTQRFTPSAIVLSKPFSEAWAGAMHLCLLFLGNLTSVSGCRRFFRCPHRPR